jgi:hypothetical protein
LAHSAQRIFNSSIARYQHYITTDPEGHVKGKVGAHTFGASDKYDPQTNQPRYPEGYAEPARNPLYPQQQAEIMAGRVAMSQRSAEAPIGLSQVVIGPVTAREIHWTKQ